MSKKKEQSNYYFEFTRYLFLILVAFVLFSRFGYTQTSQLFRTYKSEITGKVPETQDAVAAGKKIYEKKCYYCHGIKGDGKGSDALRLNPRPRNFIRNEYKIRSTPLHELPTDEDLFRIITSGIEGTDMPFWSSLSSEERWQVVYYIKTFNTAFEKKSQNASTSGGNEIPVSPESVKIGSELFKDAKCVNCHGEGGKADGKITTTLEGIWDRPYRARNLTKSWLFKGGNAASDIHRTLTNGLNETPMGSYAEYLSDEERWHLAHYVKSISKTMDTDVVLTSKIVESYLPAGPDDPVWDTITSVELPLAGQIIAKPRQWMPSVDSIKVKSFFTDEYIVFLLEWDDTTNEQNETFSDSVALQFPTSIPDGSEKPYFAMGSSGKGVTIWQWRAYDESLQIAENDLEETDKADTATDGGSSLDDKEVEEDSGDVGVNTPENEQAEIVEEEEMKPLFTEFATLREMNAKGFTNVSVQPSSSQLTRGLGVWRNGKWKVMVASPIATNDKKLDIQFEEGKLIPYALAVWDGSKQEVGGLKSISSWYYLNLEKVTPKSVYFYVVIAIIIGTSIQFWVIGRVRRFPPKVNEE
ncbi:MAG: ethylbenzene dehydrogenase-related protein [Candidatus Scalindua sp.]|nr:ethylbenzene dehydrogenase-related protein [Candidatus Scalindua sp.]